MTPLTPGVRRRPRFPRTRLGIHRNFIQLCQRVNLEGAGACAPSPRGSSKPHWALPAHLPRLSQDAHSDVLLCRTFPALPSAYAVKMEDIEARSRLASVLEVCEHEMQALEALRDARLSGLLQAMTMLRTEVVAALATLAPDASNGG